MAMPNNLLGVALSPLLTNYGTLFQATAGNEELVGEVLAADEL